MKKIVLILIITMSTISLIHGQKYYTGDNVRKYLHDFYMKVEKYEDPESFSEAYDYLNFIIRDLKVREPLKDSPNIMELGIYSFHDFSAHPNKHIVFTNSKGAYILEMRSGFNNRTISDIMRDVCDYFDDNIDMDIGMQVEYMRLVLEIFYEPYVRNR